MFDLKFPATDATRIHYSNEKLIIEQGDPTSQETQTIVLEPHMVVWLFDLLEEIFTNQEPEVRRYV